MKNDSVPTQARAKAKPINGNAKSEQEKSRIRLESVMALGLSGNKSGVLYAENNSSPYVTSLLNVLTASIVNILKNTKLVQGMLFSWNAHHYASQILRGSVDPKWRNLHPIIYKRMYNAISLVGGDQKLPNKNCNL